MYDAGLIVDLLGLSTEPTYVSLYCNIIKAKQKETVKSTVSLTVNIQHLVRKTNNDVSFTQCKTQHSSTISHN